jgi:hypothetical protein
MTNFITPIPATLIGATKPADAIPAYDSVYAVFKRPYDYHNLDPMFQPYLGAAVDYVRNGHLDKDNIKAKSFVNIQDAYAHLNYIYHNDGLAVDQKIATIAHLMYLWFEAIPPKHTTDAPQETTTPIE